MQELHDQKKNLTNEQLKIKTIRNRSQAYPSNTIAFCIELVKKIYYNLSNTNFTERDGIANALKISVSHVQTQLSSAVQYGLLDMKSKFGYKPSELFLKIYKPIGNEKETALLQCLNKPPLYNKLINQFEGSQVPSVKGLATILFRNYSITESASELAAKIFLENLTYLNLIDEDNRLLLSSKTAGAMLSAKKDPGLLNFKIKNNNAINKDGEPIVDLTMISNNLFMPSKEELQVNIFPIKLKNDRKAKLVLPEDHDDKDLVRIIRFVEGLKIYEEG